MDTTNLGHHKVPIITKDKHTSNIDSPSIENNHELQGSIGTMPDQDEKNAPRKSELVEIQTPTARVLLKASSIFPFDLFPNEIIVDEIKVTVIYKGMFSRQFSSILIKDITDIVYSSAIIMGALLITGGEYQDLNGPEDMSKGPLSINRLLKADAQTARRIILGLMIFSDQKVDTSKMTPAEIIEKTSELGRARA